MKKYFKFYKLYILFLFLFIFILPFLSVKQTKAFSKTEIESTSVSEKEKNDLKKIIESDKELSDKQKKDILDYYLDENSMAYNGAKENDDNSDNSCLNYDIIKKNKNEENNGRPFARDPVFVPNEIQPFAGVTTGGHEFDYEIYDITNDGSKIVIKGWAYTADANQYGKYQGQAGNSVAATKDYILNQHPEYQWGGYCLEVRNASGGIVGSYPLTVTERVDHTELWKGDSRNPTLIDVAFRFDVPLSDLVNKGDLYLNLHYIHPKVGDASFYLMYLAPSTSMTSGSYRVDFKADNISSFRTTGVQSFVNKDPWKGNGGVYYNGNRLYYSTNDYFYLSNGTWYNGKRSLDSYRTTWFYTRLRYTGVTQSDGWMHRTKADAGGSIYGWIPSTFIQYACSNFRLNVSYSSYKLTLNPNGGVSKGNTGAFTLSPNVIIGYGNWWNISGYTPTRTGYTFKGWYDAPSGGTKVYNADGTNVPNTAYWDNSKRWIYKGNLTVYAQWTPNIAHITYNVQGGTVGNGYGTNQYGHVSHNGSVWFHDVSYGSNSDPYNASTFGLTKTGYHFGGWRIRSTGQTLNQDTEYGSTTYVDVDNASLSTANRSEVWCYLDAIWIPNVYTITYNGNGGIWNGTNTWSENVNFGSSYVTEPNFFTRSGYTFIGWNEKPDGSGTSWTDWIGKPWTWATTENVTLYAQWKKSTFTNTIGHWAGGFKNGEGNNGNKDCFKIDNTSFTAVYQSSYIMNTNKATTIPNGFYLSDSFGTPYISGSWQSYPMGTSVTQKDGAMHFEYYYIPNTYKISYNLNGGTNNSSNPSTYNVLYGVVLKNPTKIGYTFQGWEADQFNVENVNLAKNVSKNGNQFTFTNTNSSNSFNSNKIQIWNNNESTIIKELIFESNTGIKTINYTHNYNTGNYSIRFGANGSTEDVCSTIKNIRFEKGKTYKISFNNVSVTSNKTVMKDIKIIGDIIGINPGANGSFSNTNDLYNKLSNRMTGDITLTARWKINTYTNKIWHRALGANIIGSTESLLMGITEFKADFNSKYKMDANKAMTIPNGYRLYKEFRYNNNGNYENYPIGTDMTQKSEQMSYVYMYETIKYSITYDLAGGTLSNGKTNPTNYNILNGFKLSNPTRYGYTFQGWYLNDKKITGVNEGKTNQFSDSNTFYDDLSKRTTGNLKITAKWTPNTITIKYHLNGGKDVPTDNIFSDRDPAKTVILKYPNTTGPNGLIDITKSRVTPPTGYRIQGTWNVKPDGSGKSYDFTTEYKLEDLSPSIGTNSNTDIHLYAQWTENVLTINYWSNNATKTFNGSLNADKIGEGKNVIVRNIKYKATDSFPYGLHDYWNTTNPNRKMFRDFWTGTGNYGTTQNGGILINEKTGFKTGMDLAKALGVDLVDADKDISINVYPQWRKNKLYVHYNANTGKLTSNTNRKYSVDSDGFIKTEKDGKNIHVAEFDGYLLNSSNGFYDYNSKSGDWIDIFKTGYTAKERAEWNTKPDGSGISYNQKIPYKVSELEGVDLRNGDQILPVYVNWRENILKVYYNTNKGKLNPDKGYKEDLNEDILNNSGQKYYQTFTYNHPNKNGLVNDSDFSMTRPGFKFLGWTIEKNSNDIFDQNDETIVPTDLNMSIENGDATVKLYARWQLNVDVNLNVENEIYHINDIVTPDNIRETLKLTITDKITGEDVTDSEFPGIIDKVITKELKDYDNISYDVKKNLDTRKENHFTALYEIIVSDLGISFKDDATQKITVIKDIEDIEQIVPEEKPNPVDPPEPDGGVDGNPLTPDAPDIDPNEGYDRNTVSDIRFISKKYLGTLNKNSKWKTDDNLNQKLKYSLNKGATDENAIYVIEISKEEADNMKEWLLDGKVWNNSLNNDFINTFNNIIKKRP